MDEELIAFGSGQYSMLLGLLVLARGMDFLSTWMATPNLRLEANPLARLLGWKWGVLLNLAICPLVALQPILTIGFATASFLVAGRNFQIAWLAQTMGEESYLRWMSEKLREARWGLYLFCLFAEAAFFLGVGSALIWVSEKVTIPLGIGVGTVFYAIVVVVYSLLSFWRIRRSASVLASPPAPTS
jgi:hypothetical protein